MESSPAKEVRIGVRGILPGDKAAMAEFHAHLLPESRYRRYHVAKGDLTHGELRFLTEVDQVDHVALVAFDVERPDVVLGEARAVSDPGCGDAEVAIAVRDDQQGAGVGSLLFAALVNRVVERDGRRLVAIVQSHNAAAIAFFRALGMVQRRWRDGTVELVSKPAVAIAA